MSDDKLTPTQPDSQAVEPPVRKPAVPGSPQDTSSLVAAWRRGMTPDPIAPGERQPLPSAGSEAVAMPNATARVEPGTSDPIDDALDAVLSAIIEHEARRRAEAPAAPIRATPIHWHRDFTQIPTREDSEVTALATDPVGAALRQAVHRLGQRLYERGGTDAMSEALDRVADRDPAHAGRRASIMDHAWNAAGVGDHRWWS